MRKKTRKRVSKQSKHVSSELLIVVGIIAIFLSIVILIINRSV